MDRIRLIGIAGALLVMCTGARAQAPLPDPHWGASIYPQSVPELRGGLYFNRFTEVDSKGVPFNEIDESLGINFLVLSNTQRIAAHPDFTLTYHVGFGFTNDEPTAWFQNSFIHSILGLDKVPVDDSREETEFLGGASLTRWFRPADGFEAFAGGGLVTGTLYHEPFVQVGGAFFDEHHNLRVRSLLRGSTPIAGEAFEEVSDANFLAQASLAYVPDRIASPNFVMRALGNPEIEVTFTWDSGLFVDRAGDGIDILFSSFAVRWATGLSFETWNDIFNGSDSGPTGGFGISFDLSTLFRLDT